MIFARVAGFPIENARFLYASRDLQDSVHRLLREQPKLAAAISLASPALAQGLLSGNDAHTSRAVQKAAAYILRASTRCTPYGLFSGIGETTCANVTNLTVGQTQRLLVRPDHRDAKVATIDSDLFLDAPIAVTSARLERRGWIHLIQSRATPTRDSLKSVNDVPVAIRKTAAIEQLIRRLQERATPRELIDEGFLDQGTLEALFRCDFLLSAAKPNTRISSRNRARGLLSHNSPTSLSGAFQPHEIVGAEAAEPPLSTVIARHTDKFQAAVQIDVDLDLKGSIGLPVLDDVAFLARTLLNLSPTIALEQYRRRFEERYEDSECFVPLLELIDPEVGLGAPSSSDVTALNNLTNSEFYSVTRERTYEAYASGSFEICFDRQEIERLVPIAQPRELPAAIEIAFLIIARSQDEINRGDYLISPGPLVGSNGFGRSVARFGPLLSRAARESISKALQQSVPPGSVMAELFYTPADPVGLNVAVREGPTRYQVSLDGESPEHLTTVSVDDLYITLVDGRFRIYSERLGSWVIINEQHLYNSEHKAPPVARALVLFGRDGLRGLSAVHAGEGQCQPFIPRLRCERVVLAPARWSLPCDLLNAGNADRLRLWCERFRVPDQVALIDRDSRLVLDRRAAWFTSVLGTLVPKTGFITLEEVIGGIEPTWLTAASGDTRAAEFVASLPLKREPGTLEPPKRLAPRVELANERLGWVFFRLFSGSERDADSVLSTVVKDAISSLRSRDEIDRWFFVRYSSPRQHIRLRIRSKWQDELRLRWILENEFVKPWLSTGLVDWYEMAPYEREVHRYGGSEALDVCEQLFTLDADLIVASLRPNLPLAARIDLAVASFGAGLAHLGFRIWFQALNGSGSRRVRLTAEQWALAKKGSDRLGEEAPPRKQVVASGERLLRLAQLGTLTRPLHAVFGSLYHLHCNRSGLFGSGEEMATIITRQMLHSRLRRHEDA